MNGVVSLPIQQTVPKKWEDSPSSKAQEDILNTTIQSIKSVKVKRKTKSKVPEDSLSQLNYAMGPPRNCSTPITAFKDSPQDLHLSGKVSYSTGLCQGSAPVSQSLPMSASNHPSAVPEDVLSSASARLQALLESAPSRSSEAERRLQDTLCQRRKVIETLRQELGPWGQPLSSNVQYPENMIYFQDGNPSSFWLFIETNAKDRMQEEIQALVERLPLVEIQSLVVGDLVLARYTADGKVYRARIVKVAEDSVSVRYIDYGNSEEGLPRFSLYAWDPVLEIIPAQAFLCRFSLPEGVGIGPANGLDDEEMRAFRDAMALDSLRVVVKRRPGLDNSFWCLGC